MLMIQTTWLCSAVSHMSGVRFIIDCLNIIDISLVRHRNVDYYWKDVFFASSFIFSIEYLLLAFVYTHFFIYIYFITCFFLFLGQRGSGGICKEPLRICVGQSKWQLGVREQTQNRTSSRCSKFLSNGCFLKFYASSIVMSELEYLKYLWFVVNA